jgi:hypothetical protein
LAGYWKIAEDKLEYYNNLVVSPASPKVVADSPPKRPKKQHRVASPTDSPTIERKVSPSPLLELNPFGRRVAQSISNFLGRPAPEYNELLYLSLAAELVMMQASLHKTA